MQCSWMPRMQTDPREPIRKLRQDKERLQGCSQSKEWKDIQVAVCGSGFVNRRRTTWFESETSSQMDHFTGWTSPFMSVDQQIMIFWVVWAEFPPGASPVMTCWQLSAKPVGGAQVFHELGWSDRWSQDRIHFHPSSFCLHASSCHCRACRLYCSWIPGNSERKWQLDVFEVQICHLSIFPGHQGKHAFIEPCSSIFYCVETCYWNWCHQPTNDKALDSSQVVETCWVHSVQDGQARPNPGFDMLGPSEGNWLANHHRFHAPAPPLRRHTTTPQRESNVLEDRA